LLARGGRYAQMWRLQQSGGDIDALVAQVDPAAAIFNPGLAPG
jgi:hypothetical protein